MISIRCIGCNALIAGDISDSTLEEVTNAYKSAHARPIDAVVIQHEDNNTQPITKCNCTRLLLEAELLILRMAQYIDTPNYYNIYPVSLMDEVKKFIKDRNPHHATT